MLKFKDSILNIDSLTLYQSENTEFKDEARKLLSDWLGFEPDLRASWKQELWIRETLKRIQEGKATPEQLALKVDAVGGLTKSKLEDLKNNHP